MVQLCVERLLPRSVIATPAAKPASHDVKLTREASFPQFAPQSGHVPAALLKPSVEVLGIRIDDAWTWAPLRFGELLGSEELAYGAMIESQLPADRSMGRSCLAQPMHLFVAAEATLPVAEAGP